MTGELDAALLQADEEDLQPADGESADAFENPTNEFVVEADFQFDDLAVTSHADDWSEGICDEANFEFDNIERETTNMEPLHVVAEVFEIVELQPSDSVCAPLHEEDQLIAGDDQHTCANEGCNCNVVEGEFCTPLCESVDPSESEHECGCGHTACEVTKELGNEHFDIAS
ncbi:MAG: hypothetical protein K2X93_24755 [Candidatus Obscuribacterales bacterium]|nr:hypothetical protein [Candidatus Obscuribacterales bacterium]